MTRIRNRDESDVGRCVEALRAAYQTSGYPTNWPADPDRWLRPPRTLQAWVAVTDDIPVAGHVILRQPPARCRTHDYRQQGALATVSHLAFAT
jgi:hypothetical protein